MIVQNLCLVEDEGQTEIKISDNIQGWGGELQERRGGAVVEEVCLGP